MVRETSRHSAIKVFYSPALFRRELCVYLRLRERGVVQLCGHSVPELLGHDESCLVIEMSIVQPPFVLDFAGALLDEPRPDFPPEVIEEWIRDKQELFGAHWRTVRFIMAKLDAIGIHLTDLHLGNIAFGE